MIGIIDYGMGNLKSVANAIEALQKDCIIIDDPSKLKEVDGIILPGVGAFGDGMANLRNRGFIEILNEEVVVNKKPFLGICLGMQFIAERGLEYGDHEGLGWIKGTVRKIKTSDKSIKIPHMGWNNIKIEKKDEIFVNIKEDSPVFYFVHSYFFDVAKEDEEAISSKTWHGEDIVSSVSKENIYGVQFHPEKSQGAGLSILKSFLEVVDNAR